MALKNHSTKKTSNKKDHSSTQNLRNKTTDNESRGSIKKYLIAEEVELRAILPQGTKVLHLGQSLPKDSP